MGLAFPGVTGTFLQEIFHLRPVKTSRAGSHRAPSRVDAPSVIQAETASIFQFGDFSAVQAPAEKAYPSRSVTEEPHRAAQATGYPPGFRIPSHPAGATPYGSN